MITYKQLKNPNGAVARSSGLDPCSDDFHHFTLEAVAELMRRGNWWSTVQPMAGCVRQRVVTWPREVGAILALNTCSRPSQIANNWYQFMPLDAEHVRWAKHYDRYGRAGNVMTDTSGIDCVFNPIAADGMFIQIAPSQPSDVGKTVTIFGIDSNGQVIRSQRSDGTFQDGIVLTLALPFVQSPFTIRHVTRIAKDMTNGPLNAYQFNYLGNFVLDLAQWQATEINPQYITTHIAGGGNWENVGCCPAQVNALVKLNFIPFHYDGDLVQIDNEDAIRDMVLAIRFKEQGNMAAASTYEQSALRELNKQIQDRFPIEQFQVSFRPYGSARLSKVTRGFI